MPTLARLTLWHDPSASADLLNAFDEHLTPILARHGLIDAAPCPRPAIPGILSHLYPFDTPDAVRESARTLASDPDWQAQMTRLATICGPPLSIPQLLPISAGPLASTLLPPAPDAPSQLDRAPTVACGTPMACPTACFHPSSTSSSRTPAATCG